MRSIEISLPFDGLVRMLRLVLRTHPHCRVWHHSGPCGLCSDGLTFTAGEATSDAPSVLSPTRQRSPTPAAIQRARWRRCVIVKDFSVNLRTSGASSRRTRLEASTHLPRRSTSLATDNIVGLRKDVMALRGNFNGLMQEQKTRASTIYPDCARICRLRLSASSTTAPPAVWWRRPSRAPTCSR